jgi:proteasome lid subunit RPN8/RPN11
MSGDPSTPQPIPLSIAPAVIQKIFAEARAAFPYECCGWLTGHKRGTEVDAVRPCVNVQGDEATSADAMVSGRTADTAYTIEGKDLFEFNHAFDSDRPPRIIYHSHPNGRAYFSATDQDVARSPWGDGPAYDVQHLVVGVNAQRVTEAALFRWSDEAGEYIEIARMPGEP